MMTTIEVSDILEEAGLLGDGNVCGTFVRFPCPFRRWNHSEESARRGGESFWINTEDLSGGCFSCGDRSSLWQLLNFCGRLFQSRKMLSLARKVLPLTKDNDELAGAFGEGQNKMDLVKREQSEYALQVLRERYAKMVDWPIEAEAFVQGRGHSGGFLQSFFGVRYDRSEERVVQPLRELHSGEVVGLIGRAIYDVPRKTKDYFGTKAGATFTVMSPFDFLRARRYLVVEGQFDVYSCTRWLETFGYDRSVLCVIGLNKSKLSPQQATLLEERFVPVYLMLDGDKAGKGGMFDAEVKLRGRVPWVQSIALPENDECYRDHDKGHDPDNLKQDAFKAIIVKEMPDVCM